MKLLLKRSHLAAFVIVATIIGYPVASVFANLIEIENQMMAIGLRAAIVLFAMLLFLGRMGGRSQLAVGLFTVFWGAYILRLAYTFGLSDEVVSVPASTYWLWGLGVCMIPSLAILLYRGTINFAKTGRTIAVLGSAAMVGILLLGGTAIETAQGATADQNRWNLSSINPISIGHLGASLVIVASAALLHGKATARRIIFYAAIAGIGALGIILANSRGPLVALVVALGVLGFAQIGRRRTWSYAILILLVGLGVVYRSADAIFVERGLVERFSTILTGEDRSALQRNELLADGFAQFISSPWVGDGVEVRMQAYYPHNVTLEAFMTTGMIGGFAFLILLFVSLRASFRIMKSDPEKVWLAMLTVQYIVAGQLSGAIYQSGAMWVLMTGVLSLSVAPAKLEGWPHRPRSSLGRSRLVLQSSGSGPTPADMAR